MRPVPWADMAFKGCLAAAFFFVLQFTVLKSSLEISLFWAIALGLGAGALTWSQHRRGQ